VRQYSNHFSLNTWYTLSTCRSTNVIASDEGFSNFPITQNEGGNPVNFGPCELSPTHKFLVTPVWTLPKQFQLSSIARFSSRQRYDITAGADLNGDGINNDLPVGTPYINAGSGANFFQMDFRASKFFGLPREFGKVEAIFELYNIFNNINPSGYQGNQLGSDFGQPTAFAGDPLQGDARLAQLSVRYSF